MSYTGLTNGPGVLKKRQDFSSPIERKSKMAVTVYTLPSCVQCDTTKRYLTNNGIDFTTIDLSVDSDAADYVKGLGYQAAPVVVAGDAHWSGFLPDRLNSLK